MFNPDEINDIEIAFNSFKNPENIPFPFIHEQLNEIKRKDNNLFETFSPDYSNMDYNAVIGWEGQSYHYGYKEGFFNIAHMAIVPAVHQSDSLVFPIIFNYRHYLELVLKENIFRFEIIFRLPISNTKTHDLDTLLKNLIGMLETHKLGFLISSTQKKVIQDFHEIDSNNDAFRFVFDFEGNYSHKYEHNVINLLSLHYTMNEVYNDFNAIDYLFDYGSFFDVGYLLPEYQGLIVSIKSFFTNNKNRKGINSDKKLLSLVLSYEYEFRKDKLFKFEKSSFVKVNDTKYEAGNREFALTIIFTVRNDEIESIRLK
ncbi:hypothetical protein ABR330_14010 [Bacillus cabrialesii subsp. cabrialesii]|uniref:hypothetical protein n=1 Tax=Bacillus cabrialesii TaxID=2487276 RepID=UPI00330664A3